MNEGRLWNISYHMGRQESVHKMCQMKCKSAGYITYEAGRFNLRTVVSFVKS